MTDSETKQKYINRAKSGQSDLSDLALKQMVVGLEHEYLDRNRDSLDRKISQIRHQIEDEEYSEQAQVEVFPTSRSTIDKTQTNESLQYRLQDLNYQIERAEQNLEQQFQTINELIKQNQDFKQQIIIEKSFDKKYQSNIDIDNRVSNLLERLIFE
ncbi:hypothetical protein SS50377_23266 [Spironucleus salmonicida]|uniref:Uncharacterized protein n=1 Tax=Spironucleus salmonicida TaxID=348837 RepID=V6LK00_9EUKA|nr:hypothetical protein SS50377_23266 [Spironucleus salmonicida]|eukprot:EST44061.1 Hypothetical protein SS50377_16127 [Spironucleus salmonicida]